MRPELPEEMGRGRLRHSTIDGNTVEGSAMAGQVSGMLEKEKSAEEIFKSLEKFRPVNS